MDSEFLKLSLYHIIAEYVRVYSTPVTELNMSSVHDSDGTLLYILIYYTHSPRRTLCIDTKVKVKVQDRVEHFLP